MRVKNAFDAALAITAATALSVVVVSCQMPYDADNMNTNANTNQVDFTQYAGLRIMGQLYVGEDVIDEVKPLDLAQLTVAFYTRCYDDLVTYSEDEGGALRKMCEGRKFALDLPDCHANFCQSQIYSCLGYRLLELSESIGPFELETEIFKHKATLIHDVISFELTQFEEFYPRMGGTGEAGTSARYNYRIAPLTAASKTFALRASQEAFREAGLRAAAFYKQDECMPFILTASHTAPEPTPLQYYLVGFAESMKMLGETSKFLASNQVNVAQSASSNPDYYEAQHAKWKGSVNSFLAAKLNLIGMDDKWETISAHTFVCDIEKHRSPHYLAQDFLIEAGLQETYDLSISDEDLVRKSMDMLYLDLDIDIETTPSVDDFLDHNGLSLSDFGVARRYMKAEHRVRNRILTPDESSPSGYNRVFGMGKRRKPLPASYHVSKLLGRGQVSFRNNPEEYALLGAVQTLDYLRSVLGSLQARIAEGKYNLSDDPVRASDMRRMLAGAHMSTEQLVGKRRLNVIAEDVGSWRFNFQLQGAVPGESLFLVAGNEARCLIEGTIDGAPCDVPGKAVIASQSTLSGTVVGANRPEDLYLEIDTKYYGDATRIYAFSNSPGTLSKLIGFIALDGYPFKSSSGNVDTTIPYGGALQDLAVAPDNTVEDQCGETQTPCSDVDLLRGYVPPLENELMEDANPYENSWKHYLFLAKQAAAEADRLGEQLVDYGLAMDMTSDEARRQLEAICGGVISSPDLTFEKCDPYMDPSCQVNDPYTISDPSLAQCLPKELGGAMERVPFTSLGKPVCIYQWSKSKRVCACSEQEQIDNKCRRDCPILFTGEYPDCASQYKARFRNEWDNIDWTVQWGPNTSETEAAEFILVDSALNVFSSSVSNGTGKANCAKLRYLQDDLSPYIASATAQYYNYIISRLDSERWWLNLETFRRLSSSLMFEGDLLHYYTISSDGLLLFTNKVQSAVSCPYEYPWRRYDTITNPKPDCYKTFSNFESWMTNGGSLDPTINNRKEWGLDMLKHVLLINYLADEDFSNIELVEEKENVIHAFSDTVDRFGNSSIVVPVRRNIGTECGDDDCSCIDDSGTSQAFRDLLDAQTGDPSLLPCRNSGSTYFTTQQACAPTYEKAPDVPGHMGNSLILDDSVESLAEYLSGMMCDSVPNGPDWAGAVFHRKGCGIPYDNGAGGAQMASCQQDDPNNPRVFTSKIGRPRVTFNYSVSEFIDGLEFACWLVNRGAYSCSGDINKLPDIEDRDDLLRLEGFIKCKADDIHAKAETLVIPNLPRKLLEGFKSDMIQSGYPGWQGDNLKALLAIESDLRRFGMAADNIRDILYQVSQQFRTVYANIDVTELQKQKTELTAMRNTVGSAISVAQGLINKNPAQVLSTVVDASFSAQSQVFDAQISAANYEGMVASAVTNVSSSLSELRLVLDSVAGIYSSIQSNLSNLDRLQKQASEAWANMMFLDRDTAGHVLHTNTVVRRRNNTVRERYQRALSRAKKLAYIAKRAIEFRVGENLDTMEDEMTLVPAPAGWAPRLCEMRGFDYDRIRSADDVDPLLDPATNEEIDSYSYMYIGDYVQKLEDFMESYNIDFPFSDENDLAVISLRDDIVIAEKECFTESHNLLYLTDRLGESEIVENVDYGWHIFCDVDDPLCVKIDGSVDATPFKAVELTDNDVPTSRPTGFANTGYVWQRISGNPAGFYILSWDARAPIGVTQTVDYMIVVRSGEGTEILSQRYTPSTVDFVDEELRFDITDPSDLIVELHPSADFGSGDLGKVWLKEIQLEWVDARWHDNYASFSEVPVSSYEAVDLDRMVKLTSCIESDGSGMRSLFERHCYCLNVPDGDCSDEGANQATAECFWQYTFTLTLDGVETGELVPSNNIAAGNYNYRQGSFAANLVGTNVRDCTSSSTPSTCYSNAFVPYTLEHAGSVEVRNYTGDTVSFKMPTAKIEHGKALAAEVLLTNPLTSSHSSLLSAYYKDGLRGRPLQGTYRLRIWDTPELSWTAVEDIQLVFNYRYWTRMTYY